MPDMPSLQQFRIEISAGKVAHLVFDMPGRSMNVFSNAAIRDLGLFAAWVAQSDVRGVVVRSGKNSAFCAGADLGELGQAYEMIMAAPPARRFHVAFEHFFPLSQAIRALEACGKPVAAAVAGLALGGGCELALGAHYRVAADTPQTAFGLPESLVGLLPGAGGTQRLPRVVGLDVALPVLLEGKRLSAAEALAAGLVHEITAPGQEVAAAEAWVLAATAFGQPWDQPDWAPADLAALEAVIATWRAEVLAQTLGHYPAPLAILACVAHGYAEAIDTALRTEMRIFSGLIQRPEPRDMIATMFAAKGAYERQRKQGALPPVVEQAAAGLAALWQEPAALAQAGFGVPGAAVPVPVADGYWFDSEPDDEAKQAVRAVLEHVAQAASGWEAQAGAVSGLIDYVAVTKYGFPAYLGGPFALCRSRQALRLAS